MFSRCMLLALLALAACDDRRTTADLADASVSPPDDRALRQIAAQNARVQELADDIVGQERLDAIGGGPPALSGSMWPFEARAVIAKARCDAARACGAEAPQCVENESRRLEAWPIDRCALIELSACRAALQSASCQASSWDLPDVCAASAVCRAPSRPVD